MVRQGLEVKTRLDPALAINPSSVLFFFFFPQALSLKNEHTVKVHKQMTKYNKM